MAVASTIERPDGPKGLPWVGCLFGFRKDPLGFLRRTAEEYGDLSYFKFGPQHVYLLNHPDLIREVLVLQQNNFTKSRGLRRARVLLGDGLLSNEDPVHLRHRRLVQPAFHKDRLRSYAAVMTECAERSRDRWHDGLTFDIFGTMIQLTLAVVGRTLFSRDVEADAREIGQAMTDVLEMFTMLMMPFSEVSEKLPLPSVRRFKRAQRYLDEVIYAMIAERRQSGEDYGDLLSMLLLAQDEEGGEGFSDKEVRDEALTLFVAGHETTANALSWAWYLLSQNPECEAKLHEEVDRVLDGRLPTFDDLPQLQYTERVFAETIRMYPPAWAVGRWAKAPYELGGYRIPAGSTAIMSCYVTQRDPRYYPDPDRFDPERWTPEAKEARPKFAYYPFGGGARVCIGERFAWMEGALVLATIAQRWRLRLVPGQRIIPAPVINTLRTRHGMQMVVERRSE